MKREISEKVLKRLKGFKTKPKINPESIRKIAREKYLKSKDGTDAQRDEDMIKSNN